MENNIGVSITCFIGQGFKERSAPLLYRFLFGVFFLFLFILFSILVLVDSSWFQNYNAL